MRPTPGSIGVQVDLTQSADWTTTLVAAASWWSIRVQRWRDDPVACRQKHHRSGGGDAACPDRIRLGVRRRVCEPRQSCLAFVCSWTGGRSDSRTSGRFAVLSGGVDCRRSVRWRSRSGSGREWTADDPGDGVRVGRCATIRGSHGRAGGAARIHRPAVSRQHGCVEGVAVTSEAVRCPSCQARVRCHGLAGASRCSGASPSARSSGRLAGREVWRDWDRSAFGPVVAGSGRCRTDQRPDRGVGGRRPAWCAAAE